MFYIPLLRLFDHLNNFLNTSYHHWIVSRNFYPPLSRSPIHHCILHRFYGQVCRCRAACYSKILHCINPHFILSKSLWFYLVPISNIPASPYLLEKEHLCRSSVLDSTILHNNLRLTKYIILNRGRSHLKTDPNKLFSIHFPLFLYQFFQVLT